MTDNHNPSEPLLHALQERIKELNCLFEIEKLLKKPDAPLDETLEAVTLIIPLGWQHQEICRARITYEGRSFNPKDFVETPWGQCAPILAQGSTVGQICVHYLEEVPTVDGEYFLKEEVKLISNIADRLGQYIQHVRLTGLFDEFRRAEEELSSKETGQWRGVVQLLRKTDQNLYYRLSRKMMNQLCWSGVAEAQIAEKRAGAELVDEEKTNGYGNFPQEKQAINVRFYLSDAPFAIAAKYLKDEEIISRIERWIFEDKSRNLVRVLDSQQSSLAEIVDAIRRFQKMVPEDAELTRSTMSGIRVSLIRRFLTEQIEFIGVAKNYVDMKDFLYLLDHMIMSAESHGKLGGKSAGLFLATQILRRAVETLEPDAFRVPKSWYVASDALLEFIEYNDMQEIIEHKYNEIDQIRRDYPHIVQLFKNSPFPPGLVQGLSMALDDFGDRPIIVRSSSLLEDRLGMAFAGKYKSLFLGNQGSKKQRLDALTDAISEIYASVFGPDPIEYRRERNLIDFHEEMGILIQEVVGARIGKYFLPAFAGVAFSHNEFRWSPRIRHSDGLLRIVPGLGTRAVDRVPDDYPVLIAPGQPALRANISMEEVVRYSPRNIDAIDLETNSFETVSIKEMMANCGTDYPAFDKVFSSIRENRIQKARGILFEPERDPVVATFNGLVEETPFVERMHNVLQVLKERLGTPVDVEFAHDGKDLYLLQCRPQSQSEDTVAVAIPKDIPRHDILFTANRYVSNGLVPDISHVVYIDPKGYASLESPADLTAVGRAVGKLNKLLPKRRFILMGPGRWGSKGDIRLGVNVTYSDISNTAVLIEIARKKGNYVPDLSFGTHFFLDLVESAIRYLPLYPDDAGVVFNEELLMTAENILADLLPEYVYLTETIRVIEISRLTEGKVLRVLMNAELDEAVGFLASPSVIEKRTDRERVIHRQTEDHWRWRLEMAKRIALECDPQRFGLEAFYLFGSTKNASAGPSSDIDLLLHVQGTADQAQALSLWLDGWSRALDQMNYLQTGCRSDGLLDVYYVTDDDIARNTSFAAKIGAITDAALRLPMKGERINSGRH